jgi:imidazolonepropionase-like amidohydrolase
LDHSLGSIEVGKYADIVVMTKNPLDNIRNTREIEYVLKNGVIYSGQDASRIYPNPKKAEKMYFKE